MKKYLNHNLGLVRGGGLGVCPMKEGTFFRIIFFSGQASKQPSIFWVRSVSLVMWINKWENTPKMWINGGVIGSRNIAPVEHNTMHWNNGLPYPACPHSQAGGTTPTGACSIVHFLNGHPNQVWRLGVYVTVFFVSFLKMGYVWLGGWLVWQVSRPPHQVPFYLFILT